MKHCQWTAEKLAALSAYPLKSLHALALEIGADHRTIRAKLVEMGRTICRRGRKIKEVADTNPQ